MVSDVYPKMFKFTYACHIVININFSICKYSTIKYPTVGRHLEEHGLSKTDLDDTATSLQFFFIKILFLVTKVSKF